MSDELKLWNDIAEGLGITPQTLSRWRRENKDTCPKTKNLSEWITWVQSRETGGSGSGRVSVEGREYTAADILDLKAKLIASQERRESAMASLREIELKQKKDSLIPESEAIEKTIKLLMPLRKLLDAFPRQVASMANPQDSSIAELAIREGLDERVFVEMEKLITNLNYGHANKQTID